MGYSITWEDQGIYVRYFDYVSPAEMHQSVQKVNADLRFERARYRINDYSEVTRFDWTETALEDTAAVSWAASRSRARALGHSDGLIAHVVTDPRMTEPIDRYHALGIVPYRYRIVPSLDAARRWIQDELGSKKAP